MTAYLWIKTLHVVWVIAWMASVFYLPRILINAAEVISAAEVAPAADVVARLVLMGQRLYRFGHLMFGLSVLFGGILWLGYRVIPHFPTMVGQGVGWIHAKSALVVLILLHYLLAGYWLKQLRRGKRIPSARALRWFNEIPVLALVGIVWLAFSKPF